MAVFKSLIFYYAHIDITIRLGVLIAFWPEIAMHNGIYSSANDILEFLPGIAKDVVQTGLLNSEPQRYYYTLTRLVTH